MQGFRNVARPLLVTIFICVQLAFVLGFKSLKFKPSPYNLCALRESSEIDVRVPMNRSGIVVKELIREIYSGDDPLSYKTRALPDFDYAHTHLNKEVVDHALSVLTGHFGAGRVHFILEIGSFKGGSASLIAERLISAELRDCSIVCVDPFSGDVNMWAWAKDKVLGYDFLSLAKGIPTVYETFRSNIIEKGYQDFVLPIPVPSVVGIRLLQRLTRENRLSHRPNMIFLDSAHEKTETAFEIKLSWDLLREGGLLIGDDWSWEAVRSDVCDFAMKNSLLQLTLPENVEKVCGGILLWGKELWMMQKPIM